ncbi:MAG: hypothetical protein PHX61_08125 [Alphaproteobacteria bacterium]|nr:hypothetical protein [Alphaproteobacteria bacterium]
MNRNERRKAVKAGLPIKKEPVVNIKRSDVDAMKKDAANKAAETGFLLMLGLPILVLHDKYGFGPVRCERFIDQVLKEYAMFEEGYMTMDDVAKILKDEAGITIERKNDRE